jgi:hypothetical protein
MRAGFFGSRWHLMVIALIVGVAVTCGLGVALDRCL